MTEYQKRQIVGGLPTGTNVIGSVNEARGKTILYDTNSAVDGIATVRTVTAGKTYYLLQAGLRAYATGDSKITKLWVGADSNVLLSYRTAVTATYKTSDAHVFSLTYPHPIPIAASTSIRVESGDGSLFVTAWIIGWEE